MKLLEGVVGKVVGGLVAIGVIAAGISWWQMDPATRDAIVATSGRIMGWLLMVALVPWATFYVIGRVARMESNAAGAALVGGYTLIEWLVLMWLFDWSISSTTAWVFVFAAVLLAAAYNLLACDWIAEKVTG